MTKCSEKLVLSIKPEYAEAIFSGDKTVEYRKNKPRMGTNGVYIHVCGEDANYVQGYAAITRVISGNPQSVWNDTNNQGGISESQFFYYFKGCSEAYALMLSGALRLFEPTPISDLGLSRPPQSYAYMKRGSDD